MNWLVATPIILPLGIAILLLPLGRHTTLQRRLALVGSLVLLAAALIVLVQTRQQGWLVSQVGNWEAPFGISLAVDLFGAVMLALASLVLVLVVFFTQAAVQEEPIHFGFYPLLYILMMGVNGAFTTGDLFNLYVWFEVLLMASFVLMSLGNTREQLEGSIKYVILNLVASMIFLTATGLTYALTGTLNLADLARRLPEVAQSGLVYVLGALFLTAFGIKAAVFPFFFWLPASYHTPPVVVTALFSGLLSKVGVFALVRLFTLLLHPLLPDFRLILLAIAAVTMLTGVLGAAAQWDTRRLLSFHIISQIGYLIMGLGIGTQLSLAAMVFFMVHVVLAKLALFLVAGMIDQMAQGYDLHRLGGLYRHSGWLSLLFALPALALAGLPPFSGFFAKLALVRAGLEAGQGLVVAVSLLVSLLTLFSMSKIWQESFWKPAEPGARFSQASGWMWLPVALLAVIVLALGLAAQPLFELSQAAARQMLDPSGYIQAVLE